MHVLAFSLGMIGLQHDILAALINCPFPDMVLPLAQYTFRYSWALSKAKQLFIDQCAFQLDDDKRCKECLNFPGSLVLGVERLPELIMSSWWLWVSRLAGEMLTSTTPYARY